MIVSASRRTDIPAFYSDWFMNRVRAGFFYRVNPFNRKQVSGFSLKPADVDAVVFWSKNPEPLLRHLDELDQRGFRYYIHFTLNPYGTEFEPHLPPLSERIATFQQLARRLGPERVVWRYDPVILTSATPVDWHLDQVERLAGELTSSTRRLVFSLYDVYGKGQGHLHSALQGTSIVLQEITAPEQADELHRLVAGFSAVAGRHRFEICSCSEDLDLSPYGIEHGACIDGRLVRRLFGGEPSTRRDRHQRRACGCVESVDMGSYNCCPFGCTYCYANSNRRVVAGNSLHHNPHSPVLIGSYAETIAIQRTLKRSGDDKAQLEMF